MRARGCNLPHVSVSVPQVGSTGNFSKPASDSTCDNETTCLEMKLLVLRMLVSKVFVLMKHVVQATILVNRLHIFVILQRGSMLLGNQRQSV